MKEIRNRCKERINKFMVNFFPTLNKLIIKRLSFICPQKTQVCEKVYEGIYLLKKIQCLREQLTAFKTPYYSFLRRQKNNITEGM